jgi:phosphodiesterase/alkaline phosphatase D-like protein
MFRIILLSFFTFSVLFGKAQQITHGPIVGGATDTSARFVLFSNTPATLGIQVATNQFFNPIVAQASVPTDVANGNVARLQISGLQPQTQYFYRPTINGAFVSGDVRYFKTYPSKAVADNFVITFGSCQNEDRNDDIVFAEMLNHNADLFLQVGDWGYPDNTDNLPNNPDYFPVNYNRVITSYKNKYNYAYMKQFLKTVTMAYTWDDHDYVNDNSSRNTASYTDFGIPVQIVEVPIQPETRRNAIKGYFDLFPAYEPVDSSEGIFHKFLFGNVEVYMLDDRSARSPNTDGLVNVNGNWQFSPPPGHTIIGDIQRAWLLENLKKSTATWKLITTATAFNKTYRNVINPLLNLPNIAGLPIASAVIDCWSGFPADQDSIINTVQQNGIDGVLMLSGDTHTAAMDDGGAGGLPEIMAGCLSQSNSTLFTTVPLLQFGLQWNKGGQGISTNNTNTSFGKLSVFGDDSLRMELVDANGTVFAQHTLLSCSYQSGLKVAATTTNVICNGENNGTITINATGGVAPYSYSLTGENYQANNVFENLAAGKYYAVVKDNNGCIKQTIVTINEPPVFNTSYTSVNATCNGAQNGRVFLLASGGQQPYSYSWSNNATVSNLQNLAAGNYTITIRDASGCERNYSVDINEPSAIQASLVVSDATCSNSNNGSLKIVISGGNAPYNLTWSNGSSATTRDSLLPGNYNYTVVDSNNCIYNGVATVGSPAPVQVNATVVPDISANGEGAIYAVATGGTPPYNYTWLNGSTNDSLENLSAGSYLVQVIDANGCRTSRAFVVNGATWIEDDEIVNISVYPNPAQEYINVSLALPFTAAVHVQVVNTLGQEMYSANYTAIKTATIPIETKLFATGNYFVKVESEFFSKRIRFVVAK